MNTPLSFLQEKFAEALARVCGQEVAPEVVQSSHESFGHYQCNNALKLSKLLKKSPREVAQQLVDYVHPEGIARMEIAGPGFINVTLDAAWLSARLNDSARDPRLGIPLPAQKQRVIVEFSSPNIAKELHVGHLRSTIIGDSLARLFEFLGHDVVRLNHIGDWGTQFGMLIAYMQEEAPAVLDGKVAADLARLMHWYKESKKRFDQDPDFKKRAQTQVVKLQSGDTASRRAWETICAISRQAFQDIYDLLDVRLTERGESFYNPYLEPLIGDLERKGLVTLSDGARCIFMEGFVKEDGSPLPMIIQKSDGGFNYDTTDMAAMRHRIEVEKADRIIVVTDAGQGLHFRMLEQASRLAGYLDPAKVQFDHVVFGVVLGADGKKFKTRSGDTEKLIDLLTKAIAHARLLFEERLPDSAPEEREELARVLGVDAVKYADLSCHRIKDYVFSYDRMLRFEGNTAAFLLYAYVRIESIKRKVHREIQEVLRTARIVLEHPAELSLGLHLLQFGECLEAVARDLLPNRLCDYLYGLAEKFHAFFRDCRVEGSPQEESRLLLVFAAGRVLRQGLEILGLKTVPKM
jgi:arginyl-tRNA synthetase